MVASIHPSFARADLTVPVYHSLTDPDSWAKLYLDFDGDVTQNWGPYHPGTTPAYSIDPDTQNFSQQELDNIYEIWSRVAEMYSPFYIDVTTEDPGNRDDWVTMRVVIGGGGSWLGYQAGGIGYVGAFTNFRPNTAFVFSDNLANGYPKYVSIAAAHEAGHGFGLDHQSSYNPDGSLQDEYNRGDSQKAPIMGSAYLSARALWWYGTTDSPSFFQDDLAIISNIYNGFGYRPDDHGDTFATASALNIVGTQASASGIIERTADLDLFSFTIDDAEVSFTVTGAPFGAMLDPSLALYASDGTLLQMVATSSLSETLSAILSAGSYAIGVLSAGNYGDVGQFFLSGTILPVPEPAVAILSLVTCLCLLRRNRR